MKAPKKETLVKRYYFDHDGKEFIHSTLRAEKVGKNTYYYSGRKQITVPTFKLRGEAVEHQRSLITRQLLLTVRTAATLLDDLEYFEALGKLQKVKS